MKKLTQFWIDWGFICYKRNLVFFSLNILKSTEEYKEFRKERIKLLSKGMSFTQNPPFNFQNLKRLNSSGHFLSKLKEKLPKFTKVMLSLDKILEIFWKWSLRFCRERGKFRTFFLKIWFLNFCRFWQVFLQKKIYTIF